MDCPAERHPLTNISVLIIGAGTAGVFAALECWRKGHEVRILEKAPQQYTNGDIFNIGPSATVAFRNWSGMPEASDRISYDPWIKRSDISGNALSPPTPAYALIKHDGLRKLNQHLRPKFQNMLMDYLSQIGIDVEWGSHVKEYFENASTGKGGVLLSSGQRIEADVVIAADGVGTRSSQIVTGKPVPATTSGYSIFRTAFPVAHATVNGELAPWCPSMLEDHTVIDLWTGLGMHGISWRSEDTVVWAITHKDVGMAEESWRHIVDTEDVLRFTAQIPGWSAERDQLIKATPNGSITDFKIVWRDPQPHWVSPEGRIVQIGDAAHTFLPSSGNGATQGIEDAISLATCLQLGGRDNIPLALRVHHVLRRDRVSCIQLVGVLNQNVRHGIKSTNSDANKKFARNNLHGKWLWGHDPESYAYEHYEKAANHSHNDSPYQNTNMPQGFIPGPWRIVDLIDNPDAMDLVLQGDWS